MAGGKPIFQGDFVIRRNQLGQRTMTNSDIGETTALGRRARASDMPRSAVVVRAAIAAVGLGALLPLLLLYPPITTPESVTVFLVFTAALVVSDLFFSVRVSPGSHFTIGPTFSFVFFLLAGASGAATLNALATFLVWLVQRVRKRTPQTALFALFEVGQAVLATIGGGFLVQLVIGRPVLVLPVYVKPIASLVFFAIGHVVVSTLLSSIAVYSRSGMADVLEQLWPRTTLWLAISFVVNIPFAIVLRLIAPTLGYILSCLLIFAFLAGISSIVRLNVDLRHGNEELRVLNRIGSMINATLETSELFGILARESNKVLQWDGFFIALGGRDSPSIDIVFLSSAGTEIDHRTIRQGAGLTGKAIATGELVFYEHGRKGQTVDDETAGAGGPRGRSIVIAPMLFGDEVIGAICIQSYRMDIYGPSQFRLLQTMAAQAAIAIRNAQLFQSEEEANRERDEFVSLVTHEIKNPLTSITGYAELAEESIQRQELDSSVESLRVIRDESKKILRLAEDLLDASKMAAGKFSVRFEQVDLREIVDGIARKYARTTTHEIEVSVQTELPPLDGDPIRLSQVVENLVSNAVKYSDGQSRIIITLARADERAVMTVRDFGNGIPPQKQPLIFERFYRVEEDGLAVKGTGLGLFISREIVRMHGGNITVQSTLGEGSLFCVELPIERAASSQDDGIASRRNSDAP
ncbi:MAG TPA: GAF domain-containing sensor histidine kinase [Thermoanaerobaculia bacterium]|nr:GAF domain-containing sensor histidine kinase [Thermoanaerobaculia bacterium]